MVEELMIVIGQGVFEPPKWTEAMKWPDGPSKIAG
jgi:hypothetical protein